MAIIQLAKVRIGDKDLESLAGCIAPFTEYVPFLADDRNRAIDHWQEPIRETRRKQASHIDRIAHQPDRVNALCEYSVEDQVGNVARTTIVRAAWGRGQSVSVHGWIYSLSDGLLRDLDTTMAGPGPA